MRGGNIVGIGVIVLILGVVIDPMIGLPSFILIFAGILLSVLGVRRMLTSKPTSKKDVFIKCPYCRATIPIDSEKCQICEADLKK